MGAAKKSEKFPIQILSVDKIKVDHALQSRVATSMEYQREFSEAMLRGDVFPAVTVFWDGKYYWLADGFHRLGAAKQAAKVDPKLRGIRAEIHEGTREDAMVFSAGANKEFSIPRTKEDIQKAIKMLLDIPEWFIRSDGVLAEHCGTSKATVFKYRASYCSEKGVSLPEVTYGVHGRKHTKQDGKREISYRTTSCGSSYYYAAFGGKTVYLGTDREKAEQKLRQMEKDFKKEKEARKQKMYLQSNCFAIYLSRNMINVEYHGNLIQSGKARAVFSVNGFVCVLADFLKGDTVPWAVGNLILLRHYLLTCDPQREIRMIVVCYSEDGPAQTIDLARQLGVEFLTPDELVASLKSPSAPPAEPCPPPP